MRNFLDFFMTATVSRYQFSHFDVGLYNKKQIHVCKLTTTFT